MQKHFGAMKYQDPGGDLSRLNIDFDPSRSTRNTQVATWSVGDDDRHSSVFKGGPLATGSLDECCCEARMNQNLLYCKIRRFFFLIYWCITLGAYYFLFRPQFWDRNRINNPASFTHSQVQKVLTAELEDPRWKTNVNPDYLGPFSTKILNSIPSIPQ